MKDLWILYTEELKAIMLHGAKVRYREVGVDRLNGAPKCLVSRLDGGTLVRATILKVVAALGLKLHAEASQS